MSCAGIVFTGCNSFVFFVVVFFHLLLINFKERLAVHSGKGNRASFSKLGELGKIKERQ